MSYFEIVMVQTVLEKKKKIQQYVLAALCLKHALYL